MDWELTEDPDEDIAIYVDKEGGIFIEDVKTPYFVEQVARIKYRNYEGEYASDSFRRIKIVFENGDILGMENDDYGDNTIWLRREGFEILENEKLYEYWKKL